MRIDLNAYLSSRLSAPASVFAALSLFVSPGVCLCLSVSLSVPVSVSVSIYSRVCAPASVVALSAKLDMIAGISCGRRDATVV